MGRMILLLLLLLTLCVPAGAQTLNMEDAYLTFEYPDSWLVLSPQLCDVYAPLLKDAGIEPETLQSELLDQGVLSRAYNADFSQCLSVLTRTDELSEEIYQIEQMTDSQRRTLRSRAEGNSLWESTGLRAQDVQWQREGGEYWLYIHYTITRAQETIGRGLRYVTVRNGAYVMLDWRINSGRFSNRDLSSFRARIADLTVTQILPEPMRTVSLTAEIPTETTGAQVKITGTATAGAAIVVETLDSDGSMCALAVGEAGSSGRFSLEVSFEKEGRHALTVTASREGMLSTSVDGAVTYSAKTLPVSGIAEQMTAQSDTTTISGVTLSGVSIQLITPYGLTRKRSNNNGSFSFDLTTDAEGTFQYTLILDRSGYDQRRVQFTITREMTDEQERERVRRTAEKISYSNLQKNREKDQGKVMSLYGPVTQVSGSGDVYYVRMHFNKDSSGAWFNPVVIVADTDLGLKVGDMLTAVVNVAGIYEEQDAAGRDINVPRFTLLFVDKIE